MPSVRFGAEDALSRALRDHARVQALVRTTGGIEQLAADELLAAGHQVTELSRRQLVVSVNSTSLIHTPPRVADDLFIVGADVPDPGHRKSDLGGLAASLFNRLRMPVPVQRDEPFAVSGSFVGRRNFTRFALEDAVGAVVQELTGARHVSRAGGTVIPPEERADLRVTLDGTRAILGVRPFAVPLHRREWRTRTVPGSLHPPVAAAMARLADIRLGDFVLDPFSGAGTVLLEAAAAQGAARYLGMDHSEAALQAARVNATGRAQIDWRRGDAGRLTPFTSSVDRIITNPPWGFRQSIDAIDPYLEQWRIALKPGGAVVAILNPGQAATFARSRDWTVARALDVSVAGKRARIVCATPAAAASAVTASPHRFAHDAGGVQ